jgi:hypothetical protein
MSGEIHESGKRLNVVIVAARRSDGLVRVWRRDCIVALQSAEEVAIRAIVWRAECEDGNSGSARRLATLAEIHPFLCPETFASVLVRTGRRT